MKLDLTKTIELKEGVTAVLEGSLLKIKGAKGETQRVFRHPKVKLVVEGNKITLSCSKATKREKTLIGSYFSHINNMALGAEEGFVYKLKICSGHFPMNVAVKGKEFVIQNFFGESVPRRVDVLEGAKIEVKGQDIIVESVEKEIAGQMAARIESLCRITNRDIRIFQDGCYIVNKAGKEM